MRIDADLDQRKRIESKRRRTLERRVRMVYAKLSNTIHELIVTVTIPTLTFLFLHRITSATADSFHKKRLVRTRTHKTTIFKDSDLLRSQNVRNRQK